MTSTPKKNQSKSPYKVSPKAGTNKLASFMPDSDLIQRAKSIKITQHYRMNSLKSALKKNSLVAPENMPIVIDNSAVIEEDD